MGDTDDIAAIVGGSFELRHQSVIVTIRIAEDLGRPSFDRLEDVPMHPDASDFFEVVLARVDPNGIVRWEKRGNEMRPVHGRTPDYLPGQGQIAFGPSVEENGVRRWSVLAWADWGKYSEYIARVGLRPDATWVAGPALGTRSIRFEAAQGYGARMGQVRPQFKDPWAKIDMTPGASTKGHSELVGTPR